MRVATTLACVALCGLCGCGATERDAGASGQPDGSIDSVAEDAHDAFAPDVFTEDAVEPMPSCTPQPGSASVSAESPAGTFAATSSFFREYGGECGGQEIVLLATPTVSGSASDDWPKPWASVATHHNAPDGGGPVWMARVVTATATYEQLAADVVLTSASPASPVLDGTVKVNDQGVKMEGSFQAAYCPALDVLCP